MNPGEVITVIMKFDLPEVPFTVPTSARATVSQSASLTAPGMGLTTGKIYNEYVWHCHILEHEEHDMMRPLIVTGGTGLSVAPKAKSVPSPLVTGTTIPFLVSNGNPTSFKADGTPIYSYTITSSDSVGYPVILTPTGFVTTIPALASPGIVTFTISDGTTTVTAALTVTSAVAARKGSTVKA
jgi:hypothetical protein